MLFGRQAVMALTGTTRAQMEHWVQKGIIRPSVRSAAGKGSRKEYSLGDVIELAVAKRLRDEGIKLQKIKKAVAHLRKAQSTSKVLGGWTLTGGLAGSLANLRYLTDGQTLFLITPDPEAVLSALNVVPFVVSLSIGAMIETLLKKVKLLASPKEEKITVKNKELTVILTPDLEDGGYTVQCKDLPAAISQGETEQEALDNIIEVLEEHFEYEKAGKA